MAYISMDEDAFAGSFPQPLYDACEAQGWRLWHPDDSNEEQEPYQHAIRGLCMFCADKLLEDSMMMVSSDGITGVWCSGTCLQHMIAVVFLEEVQSSILEQRNR